MMIFKRYIPLLILTLFSLSCADFLDVDSANERVILNEADIKATLGTYLHGIKDPSGSSAIPNPPARFFPNFNTLNRLCLYQSDEIDSELLPLMGYNVYGYQASPNYPLAVDWKYIAPQEILWNEAYTAIGFCNNIINEYKQIDNPTNLEQIIKGEVKVIRAWHAFKLLQYFSVYDSNELGIPLNTDADKVVDHTGKRWTQKEVYNFIKSELNEVLSYSVEPEPNYNIFYDHRIARALLAQVYHYKGLSGGAESNDWENARENAEVVLQSMSLVTNREDYLEIFSREGAKRELEQDSDHALRIFYWGRKSGVSIQAMWGYPMKGSSTDGMPISDALYDLYSDGDIRFYKGTKPSSYYTYNGAFIFDNINNGRHFISKYPIDRQRVNNETYPLFRAEELHLIIAESYAREGNETLARQWLDEFKLAKNSTSYSSNDVISEILNERRKEFVGEYDIRWMDMKRTAFAFSRVYNDPVMGEQVFTLEANDYRYAFRIPDRELTYNRELKQNPNW